MTGGQPLASKPVAALRGELSDLGMPPVPNMLLSLTVLVPE